MTVFRWIALPTGLKAQLSVFVLLTAAPLLLLLLSIAILDHRSALAAVERQVLQSARIAADHHDEEIAEALGLIRALTHVPSILVSTNAADAAPIPQACHDILRTVLDAHPAVNAIAVFDGAGEARCTDGGSRPGFSLASRDFFPLVMASEGPGAAQGRIGRDRAVGLPSVSIAVALPSLRPGDAPPGGVVADVGLKWFGRLATRMAGRGRLLEIVDGEHGTVLVPTPGRAAGGTAPDDAGLVAFIRSAPAAGVLRSGGMIYGVAPLKGAAGPVAVVVGLPLSALLATADGRLAISLLLALTLAVGAALAARRMALQTVLLPLQQLGAAAAQLGAGVPGARAGVDGACPSEIATLARALDGLAEATEARGQQLAHMRDGLSSSEAHYRLLADHGTDVIIRIAPDGTRKYVSPASLDVFGYEPSELQGGASFTIVLPEDRPLVVAMMARLADGRPDRVDIRCRRKDGTIIWVETSACARHGQDTIASSRDVTAVKLLEQQLSAANTQLELMAMQDGLTGLANRRQFDEVMEREFRRAKREGCFLGLVMVDVDRFKQFNDRYGHPAGDFCLQQIASAIQGCVCRPGDLAARYGGEEMAVLLPGADSAGCRIVAEKLQAALRTMAIPHAANPSGTVTVSLGLAAFRAGLDVDSARDLIAAADRALYAAKHAGRDTICAADDAGLAMAAV